MYFRKRNDVLLYASSEKFERVAGTIRLGKKSNVVEENDLCFRIVTADSKTLIFKPKNVVDRLNWLSVLKKHTREDSKLNENQEVSRPTLKMLASMAKNVKFEPPVAPPPTPPEFKADEIPETKEDVPCPGPAQLRVGDVTQSGDERVVGHKLLEDGKTCETLYESTTVLEKYVPPINQVTSVTALAVVATAGAAATPLLIRVIRPVIKKTWATIQKKLGKGKKKEEQTPEQIAKKYKMKKLTID